MNNRLQFRHHNEVFATREAAIEYIQSQIRFAEEGLAADDKRLGYSLLAEPTILRYVNEEDETNPHIILTIGSVTNEGTQYSENKFCIIDIDKTEQEIADLEDALIAAIKSLTLITKETDTLKLYAEKTEEGTYVSGDVKVAESHIFDDVRLYNNIMVSPEGIFLYVNLTYDENTEIFTFTVNNADGTLSETSVKLPNNYVTSGYYSVQDQSIHLRMRESDEVVIDCKYLISEWDVEGDEAKSPIYLTKEEVDFDVDDNSRLKPWQDVLRADVRIKDESFDPATGKPVYDPESVNILRRTQDKKYLFVDGKASNIVYYMDGQKSNVKEALDKLGKIKLSSDYSNILQEKTDGFFASAKLNYISKENTLVFKVSNQEETRIKLNSFRLFENVYYDSTKEALIITYIDGNDELQIVEIPIGQMLTEWEVYNEGHTVQLDKSRSVEGKDILTADVKIFQGHNNILTETNHTMYVRGEADNIKYLPTGTTTVKDVLDELKAEDARIDSKLDDEIARAEGEEQRIEGKLDQEIADRIADVDEEQARAEAAEEVLTDKIGTGFTTDPHANVTYKFETLQAQVNSEAEKLQAEIERSEAKDEEHDEAIANEIARATSAETILTDKIGTGFTTDPHDNVTYKFEQLQDQVNSEAEKLQNEINRSEAKDTEHDGRLDAIDAEIGEGFGPRNTVRDEIDNLQAEIDAVSADSSSRLSDVINEDESIDVETRDDANGKPTIKVVKVNLSSEIEDAKANIIKLNSDGLYAGVDLSYVEEANKLIFKTTNGTKEIQLESMSSIISIEYNPNHESIVITYMTNGHEIKTVEIPVGDLIREWKPSENTDGAIKLTLTEAPSGTTGKDILYGEVLISDHADNILINDAGKLYVSNADITANTAAIEVLENRMDTAEADIDALENNLRKEVSARTLADEALGARIDQEIEDRIAAVSAESNRAISAETALQTNITAEETRAKGEETRIETKLDNEVTRSIDKDTAIETALNDEVTRSTTRDLELSKAITDEVTRATSAETELQTAIETEATDRNAAILAEKNRAVSAETALQEALNREIVNREADVEAEQSRAEAAELALSDKIDRDVLAEKNRAVAAETALSGKIDTDIEAERSRAITAETALQTAINDEQARAEREEATISHALADEVSRSTAKDIEHDTKIAKNAEDIANEIVRAKANEDVISGNVISEETRAKAVEEAIKSTLSAETADRISGDTMLAHLIEDEKENRISGDTLLQANINAEESRAREIEDRLETWINNEVSRATSAETTLNAAITAETLRAQAADNELYQKVSDETAVRAAADADLLSKINQEISRAQVAENTVSEALATETNNRVNAEGNLSNAITAETQARQSADDTLQEAIEAATHTYSATTTARLVKSADNVVTADVIIPTDNNIIINDEGVKAFVRLDYDAATNKLILEKTSPSGRTHDVVTLNAGSIINSITYDTATKELVIRYTSTSDPEHTEKETRVSVADLFNPMIVNNPSSGSAVELHISKGTGELGEDEISGKVLLTNLEDNAIQIVNNGLYVPAADMQEAKEIALCAKNELSVLERAVIGHKIYEECGSGYTYEQNVDATYISGATNFYNADFKLDQNLKRVEGRVDEVSGGTVCVNSKANKIYELLYGTGSTIQGCGEEIQYSPDLGSCVISAATSFMEADRMLGDQMCEILEMWQSGETCTTKSDWIDDGANKKMIVDVKVSRGNDGTMTDDEIIIENLNGDYIDPTRTEFTDTNALRIVCLQEGAGGVIPAVNSPQNGVYLSNVWDCGLYYDEDVDADAITAANAAGYKTDNYRTDTGSTASNYNYMNNVRQ